MSSAVMDGVLTIVQESRFQVTDGKGVSHLFILGHQAAAEPADLLGLRQCRVRVRFHAAPGKIGAVATAIERG